MPDFRCPYTFERPRADSHNLLHNKYIFPFKLIQFKFAPTLLHPSSRVALCLFIVTMFPDPDSDIINFSPRRWQPNKPRLTDFLNQETLA